MASEVGQCVGAVLIDIQLLNHPRCGQFGAPGCQEVGCNAEAFLQRPEAPWAGL